MMSYTPPSSEYYHSSIQSLLGDEITCTSLTIKPSFKFAFDEIDIVASFKQNIFIWYYRDKPSREWKSKVMQWYGQSDVMEYCVLNTESLFDYNQIRQYSVKYSPDAIIKRSEVALTRRISLRDYDKMDEWIAFGIAREAKEYIHRGLAQEIIYK